MKSPLEQAFHDRCTEVDQYLDLLRQMEIRVRSVAEGGDHALMAFSTAQQRIMYSHCYLHLYSLVESTIVGCLKSITDSILVHGGVNFEELSENMRREWIKTYRKNYWNGSSSQYIELATEFCQALIDRRQLGPWDLNIDEQNWDDKYIEDICERVGVSHDLDQALKSKICRHVKNDMGVLKAVRKSRNQLAHGELSFEELGMDIDEATLKQYRDIIVEYLEFVVASTQQFVVDRLYLAPQFR